jgi:hypothetical protein
MGCKADDLAQQAGVRTSLHEPSQGHDVIGYRGVPRFRYGLSNPTLTKFIAMAAIIAAAASHTTTGSTVLAIAMNPHECLGLALGGG